MKQDAGEDVIKLLSVHSPQNQIALHRKFFIEVFEVKVFKEKDFTIFKATQEGLDPVGYNNACEADKHRTCLRDTSLIFQALVLNNQISSTYPSPHL